MALAGKKNCQADTTVDQGVNAYRQIRCIVGLAKKKQKNKRTQLNTQGRNCQNANTLIHTEYLHKPDK